MTANCPPSQGRRSVAAASFVLTLLPPGLGRAMIPYMGYVREQDSGRNPLAARLHELASQMREALRTGQALEAPGQDPSLRELVSAANELIAASRRFRDQTQGALRE